MRFGSVMLILFLIFSAIGGIVVADQISLDQGPFIPPAHEPYVPAPRAPEVAVYSLPPSAQQ